VGLANLVRMLPAMSFASVMMGGPVRSKIMRVARHPAVGSLDTMSVAARSAWDFWHLYLCSACVRACIRVCACVRVWREREREREREG
jgi:hypothetical protein